MRMHAVVLAIAAAVFSLLMGLIDESVMVGPPLRLGLIASAAVLAVLAVFRLLRAHDDQLVVGLSWFLVAATMLMLLILVLASLSARE